MQINFAANWKIEVFSLFFSSKYRGKYVWKKRMIAINKSIIFSLYIFVCAVFLWQVCLTVSLLLKLSVVWKFESSPRLHHDSFPRPLLLPLNNPSTHIKWYFSLPSALAKSSHTQQRVKSGKSGNREKRKKYKTQWKAIETIKKVLNKRIGKASECEWKPLDSIEILFNRKLRTSNKENWRRTYESALTVEK